MINGLTQYVKNVMRNQKFHHPDLNACQSGQMGVTVKLKFHHPDLSARQSGQMGVRMLLNIFKRSKKWQNKKRTKRLTRQTRCAY